MAIFSCFVCQHSRLNWACFSGSTLIILIILGTTRVGKVPNFRSHFTIPTTPTELPFNITLRSNSIEQLDKVTIPVSSPSQALSNIITKPVPSSTSRELQASPLMTEAPTPFSMSMMALEGKPTTVPAMKPIVVTPATAKYGATGVFVKFPDTTALLPTVDPLGIKMVLETVDKRNQEWGPPAAAPLPQESRQSNGVLINCDCFTWNDLISLPQPSTNEIRSELDFCYQTTTTLSQQFGGDAYMIINGQLSRDGSSVAGVTAATGAGFVLLGTTVCDQYRMNDGVSTPPVVRTRFIQNGNYFDSCKQLLTNYCNYVGFPIEFKQ